MLKNIIVTKMDINDLETIKNSLTTDFNNFWNYNIFKQEINSENSYYIVATLNSEIIGFAGIKIIIDEADIMNIVTKKSIRNSGVRYCFINKSN